MKNNAIKFYNVMLVRIGNVGTVAESKKMLPAGGVEQVASVYPPTQVQVAVPVPP